MNQKLLPFSLLIVLFILAINPVFSQIDSTAYMDYATLQREIAVDIIPVFGGSNPASIFFRHNTQNEGAGPTAFRLQFNFFNNFSFGPDDNGTALNNSFFNAYGIQMGKEWQKSIDHRMLAYSGFDLGLAFGNSGNRASGPRAPGNIYLQKQIRYIYSATLFFGVKYHLHQRISASAEMGIQPNFQRKVDVTQFGSFNAETRERKTTDALGLRLLPLNALRLSYHF